MSKVNINDSAGFYTLTIPEHGVSIKFDYALESDYGFHYLLQKLGTRQTPEVVATVENVDSWRSSTAEAFDDLPEPPRSDAADYDAPRPRDPQEDSFYYRGESGTSPTGPFHAEWECTELQKSLAGNEIRIIQKSVLADDAERCEVCG